MLFLNVTVNAFILCAGKQPQTHVYNKQKMWIKYLFSFDESTNTTLEMRRCCFVVVIIALTRPHPSPRTLARFQISLSAAMQLPLQHHGQRRHTHFAIASLRGSLDTGTQSFAIEGDRRRSAARRPAFRLPPDWDTRELRCSAATVNRGDHK